MDFLENSKKNPRLARGFFFQQVAPTRKPASQKSCEKRMPMVRGWVVMV
jgi:hypothetical protein